MIRRPPRSTLDRSSAASDVYKRQVLRLRWAAILHGRIRPSIALTGGVATPDDGIKALLAGADVVQLVSALLRHGPGHVAIMRDHLERWLTWQKFERLDEAR